MYKLRVNGKTDFELELEHNQLKHDGEFIDWDMVEVIPGAFHIIYKNQSYVTKVVDANHETKQFTIRVNGNDYAVEAKDKYDLLLQQLGMSNLASAKVNDIKAPMPGLVLSIGVEEGQTVKKGDAILILEAMKMENVLKSPGEGKVKSIKVKKGDAVEKNQVLVVME